MFPVHDGESAVDTNAERLVSDDLHADEVRRQLGLASSTSEWLGRVERPANSRGPVLPGDAEAARLLERLGVAESDRADTLAARPDPITHPALWWVLDRLYHDMLAHLGQPVPNAFAGWPAMPTSTGTLGRHLYVWLYLAVLPFVRRYHTEQGVPNDMSWANLSGLSGAYDFGHQWSLPLIYRGVLYDAELGRLAYDRHLSPVDFAADPDMASPPRRGEDVVNVHIPERGGPLDPLACDESIAQARGFFTSHFPERPAAFVCHTWILDEQLADYLPETSNIIRFQRRFRLSPEVTERADRFMLRLIFKRDPHDWKELPGEVLDELPQDTTLQRAFVTHLRAGRHWFNRTGWFPL